MAKVMKTTDIIEEYLKKNGYDGLYVEGECACLVDDLCPCGEMSSNCAAGYRTPCDCGDHDYHVGHAKAKPGCIGCGSRKVADGDLCAACEDEL